ncbi:unnamed protein product [Rotaria sp. Silwood2]|nr:unnamed protein product [Rotaria sp. Silwood2]CAF3220651.1 unnamed protein product [Rotaria sp. Silwood2]CAF3243628.1 unnamed protein product [Rotaria sp. Silwood2]CAF4188793.1 unnamed protein product [Rotaria sp. Silwood2]CAF4366897.1 unnamed protein product [Rotaria sp. Silwood2]
MEYLNIIANKLMSIAGILMIIFGTVGNILSIFVFTKWSYLRRGVNENNNNSRTNNSALYLLVSSWANLIIILFPLVTRVAFDGYGFLVAQDTVLILCKFRYYVLFTFDLLSLGCICMALVDRYLISSKQVHLRQLTPTKRQTKQLIFLVTFLLALHSIPLLFYWDVTSKGICRIFSPFYSNYFIFAFQIILHGIIPIGFLSVFGVLIYKQLRMIKKQSSINSNMNADKQASCMILLTSISAMLSSIPYSIEQTYYVVVGNDDFHQSSIVFLCHVISSILFYMNVVTSFYIYYFSTPNFRKEVHKLILCKTVDRHFTSINNQVVVSVSSNQQK